MSMNSGYTDRKVRKGHERIGYPIEDWEPSLTQQQFVEECDINNILKRNKDMNVLPLAAGTPMFGDFSDMPSYHEAMNIVVEARTMFEALPSEVRTKFHNNPQEYLDFMSDDANYDEAVRLGLCQADEPAPGPIDVNVVNPAPATPAPDAG